MHDLLEETFSQNILYLEDVSHVSITFQSKESDSCVFTRLTHNTVECP